MADRIDELEHRIERLRGDVRRAALAGDRVRARALRAELRLAERAWDTALAEIEELAEPVDDDLSSPQRASLLPVRDQVHQALTLLSVPAAPRLIISVHEAFSVGDIASARLTSLRRDEERSFRSAPFARPYYICCALTADLLAPARGLLAVSTWPMQRRIVGPLSPRADFLTAAVNVARYVERLREPRPAARRLLWRFAANIPGAVDSIDAMKPQAVASAAEAELKVHRDVDASDRAAAAARARARLDDSAQLFGSHFRAQAREADE